MKLTRALALTGFLAAMAAPLAANAADDPVVGTWWNEKKTAQITIEPCGDSVCGKISWLAEPNKADGTPKVDANNEDEALQTRPIVGLQIIGGFTKEKRGVWEDGEIYNPEDGKTYDSNLEFQKDGNLGVEGCVFIICQEQTWTPVKP